MSVRYYTVESKPLSTFDISDKFIYVLVNILKELF